MKRKSRVKAHLYNQIVFPLLVASVIVGIVATVVASYFLEDLTAKWVSQVAQSSTENIAARYGEHVGQMQREAQLCVNDDRLLEALRVGDLQALRHRILVQERALAFDNMVVLDAQGRALASVGTGGVEVGTVVLPRIASLVGQTPSSLMTTLTGRASMTVLQPIPLGGQGRVLAVSHAIDDHLLRRLGVGAERAVCFFGADFANLACVVGEGFDPQRESALQSAMKRTALEIEDALQRAAVGDFTGGSMRVGDDTYQLWVEPVVLPFDQSGAPQGYLVGIASKGISQETVTTTRNLIAMWSLIAVLALVGMGGWIARTVSDPLTDLAAGAGRIADGDFSTKVEVRGSNEIAELAGTFNVMTDSLREHSESLTKKVLELATLYEMSRSLGSSLDMEELLGTVLESALRIFDLDLGYVALRDRESGALALRAIRGAQESSTDGAVRSSMSEWVVREGRPLIFNPDTASRHDRIDTVTGAKAALCVPLVSAEGTIGSITIGSSRSDYRFSSDDVRLLSTIANHVTIAIGNIELFSSLQEAYLATVRSLAAAVDAKDTFTRGHSDRVATYAMMIGERMGLSHDQRIALEMAAYLHDIGKIGVPEEILLKPGRLDDDEMAEMRHHPLIGANILKPVAFPWAITPVVRHHHESYDGSGYPAGLRGEEIPLLARILTVADSYEAMTSDRPYRVGRDQREAIEELRACAGKQFDFAVVEIFAELLLELEESGETVSVSGVDDIAPEEARAIFVALIDGVLISFRKLGGPRLSSNVEREIDEYFVSDEMPFRVVRGRVSHIRDGETNPETEIVRMRTALRRIDVIMSRVSGTALVSHFYADALQTFSGRMKHLALMLDYCEPG